MDFKRGGLITSILAVLVCPWIFVDSPHAITIFVSVFGAILAPLYGVMVADYYLVKREIINTPELYTMAATGRYHYDGGWNHVGLKSLAVSGFIAIGWELCTQLFHILPAEQPRLGHRRSLRRDRLHDDDAAREAHLTRLRRPGRPPSRGSARTIPQGREPAEPPTEGN